MLNVKEILSLIGFNGECSYGTLQELHDDPDLLFSPIQQLKLQCIKDVALEIQTEYGTEIKYPEGYDPEEEQANYKPLENVAHRKLFHPDTRELMEDENHE